MSSSFATRTLFAPPRSAWRRPGDAPKSAARWVVALAKAARARAQQPHLAAVAVLIDDGTGREPEVLVRFASRISPAAVVLGRHPACDGPSIRGASLRHLLLLLWADHAGTRIEAIDLKTQNGTLDARGRRLRQRAFVGPARFAVGDADVTLLSAAPNVAFPDMLPDELDDWLAVGEATVGRQCSMSRLSQHATFIPGRVSRYRRSSCGGLNASTDELHRGLLLGRYARCDRQFFGVNAPSISRVHAMLLARNDYVFVVDLGSTPGTHVIDDRTGAQLLTLGSEERLHALSPEQSIALGPLTVRIALHSGRGLRDER